MFRGNPINPKREQSQCPETFFLTNEGTIIMDKKNMYERFVCNELPEKLLESVKTRASFAKSNDEYWFVAGFFLAMKLEKYKNENGEIDFIVNENENNKS